MSHGEGQMNYAIASGVRRLLPEECELLQAFPKGYTAIPFNGKPASDSVRYKALGNSMACNVMSWLASRIQMAEDPARPLRDAPNR